MSESVDSYIPTACILAASHLLFFLYLSGRPSDGQDHSLSQTYSTTISIMLAGMFGIMLRLGISAAFTQYLWHLLRAKPISAATIERMFILRSSPASILFRDVLVKAWPLVFMACLSWSTSIAMSFPPGALTINASCRTFDAAETEVSTFNASDVGIPSSATYNAKIKLDSQTGNGTWNYISSHSLTSFGSTGFLNDSTTYLRPSWRSPNLAVEYLVERTLINKEIAALPSPCGQNCSYRIEFTGPYIRCEKSVVSTPASSDTSMEAVTGLLPAISLTAYNASMSFPPFEPPKSRVTADSYANDSSSQFTIQTTTVSVLGVKDDPVNSTHIIRHIRWNETQQTHTCVPSKSKYQVWIRYEHGRMDVDISMGPASISPLVNIMDPLPMPKSFWDDSNQKPLALNKSQREYIQDANLMMLILQMTTRLSGALMANAVAKVKNGKQAPALYQDSEGYQYFRTSTVLSSARSNGKPLAFIIITPSTTTMTTYLPTCFPTSLSNPPNPTASSPLTSYSIPANDTTTPSTLVQFTPIYTHFHPSLSTPPNPNPNPNSEINTNTLITISQPLLNALLTNITLSAIPLYNLWTTRANATVTQSVNIYTFSRPGNLLVPYALCLALTFPCLVLGFVALHVNGVSAIDGGFLQVLCTTRGSATVDRVAMGACLGGEGNMRGELKGLRLMFGELVCSTGSDQAGTVVRRAGFGTEGEVIPLSKDRTYGGSFT